MWITGKNNRKYQMKGHGRVNEVVAEREEESDNHVFICPPKEYTVAVISCFLPQLRHIRKHIFFLKRKLPNTSSPSSIHVPKNKVKSVF